ncbi:acyl-CoA N-acyltransferase [Xylogone sp. PMI_703]|nr:acyl-CoA N-acyltransferase [Xylogone sp. PMI_703]
MAATPFISLLTPPDALLDSYDPKLAADQQPQSVPKTFVDAMTVRQEIFVREQGVPLENEFDADDQRSCHWVIYASINEKIETDEVDESGNKKRLSVTRSQPIGTIRLVPFPHPPHPEPGSSYAADALETAGSEGQSFPPPYIVDRATTHHDGREPYVKLGRLAVVKEFRGTGLAKLLVSAAVTWAQQNPTYFNPSVEKMGMENLNAVNTSQIPVWKGLFCVHAQEQVVKVWEKWGFQLDEGMGTWIEEGIKHVGMFKRIQVELKD